MTKTTDSAACKDMEITRKFHFLNEVNITMNASIDAAKKNIDSIRKFIKLIGHLHPKTNNHAGSGN